MENTDIQAKKSLISIGGLLGNTWKFYKKNFRKLWPLFILATLVNMSYQFNNPNVSEGTHYLTSHVTTPMLAVGIILLIVILIFLVISKIALFKSITDIHAGQFSTIGASYKKAKSLFWSFVLLEIILYAASFGSYILPVIPGIIMSGYLIFAEMELFATDKRNFKALLGSWALVKNYWWNVALLLIGTSIVITVPSMIAIVITAIVGVLLTILLSKVGIALGIAVGVIFGLALFAFVFLFLSPFLMIVLFELYYNVKEVRASELAVENATLQKSRKNALIFYIVIGILAVGPIIYFGNIWSHRLVEFQNTANQASMHRAAILGDVSSTLQDTPYVSTPGQFSLILPTDWSFGKSTTTPNPIIDNITVFKQAQGASTITVSKINAAALRTAAGKLSDEQIIDGLATEGVNSIKEQFDSLGLEGFQVSDLQKQDFGADTAYVYRGSASTAGADVMTYDFDLVTIFSKNHAYQIIAIWPESAYGRGAAVLMRSIGSFTIAKY